METKANYAIVGLFTVLVIAAAFGFVYWMAQYGRGGPMSELVIRIPGSANGLSVGSPVRFNGIAIGSVRGLTIDAEDPKFSVAFAEVKSDAPIYQSTKAVLEIQGLTGAAYVELSGGNTGEKNILRVAEESGKTAVLAADQSSVTNLLATADKIMGKADDAIGDIQSFVRDARGPLTNTVKNAEKFSTALSNNSDGIEEFLKSVSALSTIVTGLSGRLDGTMASVQKLIAAVDADKINAIVSNAATVSQNIADASAELKGTVASVKATADTFIRFGNDAERTLNRVDTLIASIDPAKVGASVDDIKAATSDARVAIASIRGVTDTIANRQAEIDETIKNASEISNRLNTASTRVDGILVKVDKLLGSDDANSLAAEARRTLLSYKQVAETINARIGPIADNLSRFSSTGLRDVQTLVNETRRTVQGLSDTINNFDRNPQRLLFGGDTVKQYNGRVRR